MIYSLPLRFSCRNFSNGLLKTYIINNIHHKGKLTGRIIYPALASFSKDQQSFLQFSSQKKMDNAEDTSKSQIEKSIKEQPVSKVNLRTKLKQAVRDYGATIVVFHIAVSLTSLGLCYLAISCGVDVIGCLRFLGFSESIISSKVAVGGSTFFLSYAVHKMFAPFRIGITLTVAPLIAIYLRKINWLKPLKKK